MRMLLRRWRLVVAAAVLGGGLAFAEYVAGGNLALAIVSFTIVVGYAAAVTGLQNRSETASLLAGHPLDERWSAIHEHALAFTAQIAVGATLLLAAVAELQHRDSGAYSQIAVVLGLSYLGGVLFYRGRS